jgi:hypothetical protein
VFLYDKERLMKKAESAFEISRLVAILFWMPIIVLTFLSFIIR